MPVNSPHSEYTANLEKWNRARAVLGGEDAVKNGGVLYLPKLSDQDTDDYESYKARAVFFNATARTVDSFVGMIYRKDPTVEAPDTITELEKDITLQGQSFYDYGKAVVREVIGMGRSGTLIDWSDEEERPYVCNYTAEQIINWRTRRVGGRTVLGLVVLKETVAADEMLPDAPDQTNSQAPPQQMAPNVVNHYSYTGPAASSASNGADDFAPELIDQFRVLRLNYDGTTARYSVEIWRRTNGKPDGDFSKVEEIIPTRKGQPIDAIPFVFHGPNNVLSNCDKIPVEDIISINLSHYRTSADLEHGRHWTGLPTPFISGVDQNVKIVLGSQTAITSTHPEAKATFLEFKGEGLKALETAIAEKEHQMSVLGARMLEQPKKAAETVEVMQMKQTGEQSSLMQIAFTVGESFELIIRWALYWMGTADSAFEDTEDVTVELNSDFNMADMDPALVTALVGAYMAGTLTLESLVSRFKQADIIPAERSVQDELDMLATAPPPLMQQQQQNQPPPKEKPGKTGKSGKSK